MGTAASILGNPYQRPNFWYSTRVTIEECGAYRRNERYRYTTVAQLTREDEDRQQNPYDADDEEDQHEFDQNTTEEEDQQGSDDESQSTDTIQYEPYYNPRRSPRPDPEDDIGQWVPPWVEGIDYDAPIEQENQRSPTPM